VRRFACVSRFDDGVRTPEREVPDMNDRRPRPQMAGQRITTAILVLSVLGCGPTVWAQPAGHGQPLLAAAQREGVRLAHASAPGSQPGGASGGNWIVRHPVVSGTAIGAGAGLALSQIDSIGGLNHDRHLVLVGAGGGAWGGLIASAVQSTRAGKRVGLGTKVGIVAGAVASTVLPALAFYAAGG
jgi:hypothetical protein